MRDIVSKFCRWAFNLNGRERTEKNATEKLKITMRVTANCRYNGAKRLDYHRKFTFFTTTFLSLGLVFIPLIQNTGVSLAFKPSVLNMMQIFLAVAALVYSVVIGTARYDIRAAKLTECADKLKELNRKLEKETEDAVDNKVSGEVLARFQTDYSNTLAQVENQSQDDYIFAMLDMKRDYIITGLPRLKLYLEAYLRRWSGFILPLMLLGIELVFISDMMGVSSFLTEYLNGNPAAFE